MGLLAGTGLLETTTSRVVLKFVKAAVGDNISGNDAYVTCVV